jgi:hypothetical protein
MRTGICEVVVETGQGWMTWYHFLANRDVFWNSLGPYWLWGRNFASYAIRKATEKGNFSPPLPQCHPELHLHYSYNSERHPKLITGSIFLLFRMHT